MEAEAIIKAYQSDTLTNALFAKTNSVSTSAKDIFAGVYTKAKDGGIDIIKTLPVLTNQAQSGIRSILQAAGSFMSKSLFPAFSVPIIIIPSMLTPFQNIKISHVIFQV